MLQSVGDIQNKTNAVTKVVKIRMILVLESEITSSN